MKDTTTPIIWDSSKEPFIIPACKDVSVHNLFLRLFPNRRLNPLFSFLVPDTLEVEVCVCYLERIFWYESTRFSCFKEDLDKLCLTQAQILRFLYNYLPLLFPVNCEREYSFLFTSAQQHFMIANTFLQANQHITIETVPFEDKKKNSCFFHHSIVPKQAIASKVPF